MEGAIRQGGSYTQLIWETHRRHPSSFEKPWRLIAYSDEFVPGNALANRQGRKAWAIYASFLEHELHLCHEDAWLVLAVMRSNEVKKVDAGISQIFGMVLKFLFCNENFSPRAGLLMRLPDGTTFRVYFKLGMLLQDGGAHKYVYGVKGDAGSKFCLSCKTNFGILQSPDDEDSGDDPEEISSLVLLKHSELEPATDAEIRRSARRLAERFSDPAVRKTEFKLWEQACGMNYQPAGLLFQEDLEAELEPISHYCHDWMHGMCSNGCMNKCLWLFFLALQAAGFPVWTLLPHFVAQWSCPGEKRHLADLFESSRVEAYKNAKKFKATASEVLASRKA